MPKAATIDVTIMPSLIEDINTVETPELGPPPGWPGKVWVIAFSDGTHGCLVHHTSLDQIHGLASFKSQAVAERLLGIFKTPKTEAHTFVEMSFGEACDLAGSKGEPLRALFLVERLGAPLIFYVR